MNSKLLGFLCFCILVTKGNTLFSQGCSDAGFCTVNGMKPESHDSSANYKYQFKTGLSYGKADNSINILANYFELGMRFSKSTHIDFKITSILQNGNGIQTGALSDVFIVSRSKLKHGFNINAGIKLPLNNGNKLRNGSALPMDYQSSLGTVDLIGGISWTYRKLQIHGAFQLPLTQNENTFLSELQSSNSALRNFQSTNKFQRKSDVLLRISYPVNLSKKLVFTSSLLPIYHLSDDSYTDTANNIQKINGSKGLTLNGNVFLDLTLGKRSVIQLNYGMPFIVRKARPDGLTRHFILTLEYRYQF